MQRRNTHPDHHRTASAFPLYTFHALTPLQYKVMPYNSTSSPSFLAPLTHLLEVLFLAVNTPLSKRAYFLLSQLISSSKDPTQSVYTSSVISGSVFFPPSALLPSLRTSRTNHPTPRRRRPAPHRTRQEHHSRPHRRDEDDDAFPRGRVRRVPRVMRERRRGVHKDANFAGRK